MENDSESMQLKAIDTGFSKVYDHYEWLNKESLIDQTMRNQVHQTVLKFIKPHSSIIEINSGSGIDAVFFAKLGYTILATDVSEGAEMKINEKIRQLNVSNLTFKKCSFLELDQLHPSKFDYLISNFGGLNCSDELQKVFHSFDSILLPNAHVTMVILGKYYPWDWIYALKLKFRRAFMRLSKSDVYANIEGEKIKINYYIPKQIIRLMPSNFELQKIENLGFLYPSVNHQTITKQKKLIALLIKIDAFLLKKDWIPKGVGDYFIITFKKK